MRNVSLVLFTLLAFVFAAPSCRKKEQPPPPPQSEAGQPGSPHGSMGGAPDKMVVVPESVKGAWKGIRVEVEFKEKKSGKQFSIPLNSEFQVPDSDLTLKVGEFLPHFSMTGDSITSASNNPENPAVRIEVLEKGNLVFKGWLFAKFPDVHPLVHDKYGLKLVEGERK